MIFSFKRTYAGLIVLFALFTCLNIQSKERRTINSNAIPHHSDRDSHYDNNQRHSNNWCGTICMPETTESMTEEDAYNCGQEVVKFAVTYMVDMGQGNFFQNLKEMILKGKALELKMRTIRNSYMRSSGEIKYYSIHAAFVKGFSSQFDKENVHEFVEKARFAEWQKKIVIDVWNFIQKQASAIAVLNPQDWTQYTQDHAIEYMSIYFNIIAAVTSELKVFDLLNKKPSLDESTTTDQEAFDCGRDAVKFALTYIVELGQGNFFQKLKEIVIKGTALKIRIEKVMKCGRPSPQQAAFVRGLSEQFKKENVHEFVEKARFADSQKKIVIDIWNHTTKQLRERDFSCYTPENFVEDGTFYSSWLAALTSELGLQ